MLIGWVSAAWGLFAGKARGFAFAGFMCRAHAERGIKVANGQVCPVILSCMSQGMAVSAVLICLLAHSCSSDLGATQQNISGKPHNSICKFNQAVGGRTIAVDWAVSKADYKSASAADASGDFSAP